MPRTIEIELTKLRPNSDQPRKRFNQETIKELAASIEQHGLIQSISVVPDPQSQDGFVIVAGERRWKITPDRAKKRKAGEDITTTEPQPKKPTKLFRTAHKASVIVQSETARLTRPQIISALRESLDQAEG